MAGEATNDLPALLVCPDQVLSRAFLAAAASTPELVVVAEVGEYLDPGGVLDLLEAQGLSAIFLDVGTSRDKALELLSALGANAPHVAAAGLGRTNDPEAILQCLRLGAAEFIASPFPPADLRQAVKRMLARRGGQPRPETTRRGKLHVFAPVKGGAGATTLAAATAFQLHSQGECKVLLADLDLAAGVIGFLLRLRAQYSALDALRHAAQLDEALWRSLVSTRDEVDILAAPDRPEPSLMEAYPVQELLDFARGLYDHVVIDLSSVVDTLGMTAVNAADQVNLVCSSDMAALYLMRQTIPWLEEMGQSRDQVNVLVNRLDRRADLGVEELEKVFRASVHSTFPNDPAAVEKAQREGVPVARNSELGRSVSRFVQPYCAPAKPSGKGAIGALRQLWGRA